MLSIFFWVLLVLETERNYCSYVFISYKPLQILFEIPAISSNEVLAVPVCGEGAEIRSNDTKIGSFIYSKIMMLFWQNNLLHPAVEEVNYTLQLKMKEASCMVHKTRKIKYIDIILHPRLPQCYIYYQQHRIGMQGHVFCMFAVNCVSFKTF